MNSIYRIKEVVDIIGLSRSAVYDKLNPRSPRFDPMFPKAISLGPRAVGWLSTEIHEWIDSRTRAQQSDEEMRK